MNKIKVAAVQMNAKLGDIDANMKKAEGLIEEAFSEGAKWVIVPEFFTTAMAYHPSLLKGSLPFEGPALKMLRDLAMKHDGFVGGSFVASKDGDCYNTFVLAMPDGSYATHDKDQPTMWENCYYVGGGDDGIIDTPDARVGVAMCWEFVRSRTPKRLIGKIDLLVGGSCWWTVPRLPILKRYLQNLDNRNLEIMIDTPSRMLGVPVIHAAHAGDLDGDFPLLPGIPYLSFYLGETQIVDADGNILARLKREDGDGIITAELELGSRNPTEEIPRKFWIPRLPLFFRIAWMYMNLHGRSYYKRAKRDGKLMM
ncbi:MAG: carbon-nitrogen hydrolase family protein [Halobacteriota archaeon]|nr:carbon-nitrogen hydrolase family protein [Halobacteriota archaeon]